MKLRLLAKTVGTAFILALSLVQTGQEIKTHGTSENVKNVPKIVYKVYPERHVQPFIPFYHETVKSTPVKKELSGRGEDSVIQYGPWMNFIATAYDGQAGINGTGTGLTRTGKHVAPGMVAVDPSVIPLHSEIEVELGDGTVLYLRAEDTGGAILGNRIDIYNPSYGWCINFGRQPVQVRIVEGAKR